MPITAFEGFDLKLTLKGITRIKQHCPKRATPMTPAILSKIHQVLDHHNPVHATMWCLFLLSFYTLARKSNLVSTSPAKFDSTKQLCRSDVKIGTNGLIVTFKWTKTIQFGQRKLQIPIVSMPESNLCLLKAYQNMLSLVPASSYDPAFLLPSTTKPKPVCYKFFQKFLKSCITVIGLKPDRFSLHSFRRGGANLAFRAKVPSELIKIQGDWASQAYLQYLDFTLDQRLQVSMCMSNAIMAKE